MKNTLIMLLFLGYYYPVFATIKEATIEVDPFLYHSVENSALPGTNIFAYRIKNSLEIAIPDIALSSGDTFRVNISFSGNRYLKAVNAEFIQIQPLLSTAASACSGWLNNCFIQVQITKYQNINNATKSQLGDFCSASGGNGYSITDYFYWHSDEITEGSLLGGFQIEFEVPTMRSGTPVPLTNYTYNNLLITSTMYNQYLNDVKLLEVIPEPATMFLLGLGGLLLRRK